MGLTYNFYRKYVLSGNANYNNIISNETQDLFVTGFNTPKYVTNLSIGNREVGRSGVTKNIGFNVVWRWQDSFLWQSPLADGVVPAYYTVDAQFSYRWSGSMGTQPKLNLKLGASNLFNHHYIQYAAGPTLGALYYMALTWDVSRW